MGARWTSAHILCRPAGRIQPAHSNPFAQPHSLTMTDPYHEFDLLLEAPSATNAKLAQNLLEEAGIPSMLHGQDRGEAVHMNVARPDVLVPKGSLPEARKVLTDAWGEVEWPKGT